jgi:chemotaxis signal transduction protein
MTAELVFAAGPDRFAIPAASVARVLPPGPLVRLPGAEAVQFGDELLPLVPLGQRSGARPVIVMGREGGRVALEVDAVLGVGARTPWDPVRSLPPDLLVPPAPAPRPVPLPSSPRRRTVPPDVAVPPPRLLRVEGGGGDWTIPAPTVVSVHDETALEPVPGADPRALAAAMLRGRVRPVVKLPGTALRGAASAVIVLRTSHGALGFAVDRIGGWCTAWPGARPLDPEAAWQAAALTPYAEVPDTAARAVAILSALPVLAGSQRYGLMLGDVLRVLPPPARARLPEGAGRLQGAVAIDGRVVPLTDLRPEPAGPPAMLVHVRVHDQSHALAVDGVERPVRFEAARLQPIADPAGRLAGLVRLPGGTLPVLDLARLLSPA